MSELGELGQRLIAAVREIAAEQPDFIYQAPGESCVYVHNGCPSCIIGQALWRLGLIDANLDPDANTSGIRFLINNGTIPALNALTQFEVTWLRGVQFYQDSGQTWGSAVAYADEVT